MACRGLAKSRNKQKLGTEWSGPNKVIDPSFELWRNMPINHEYVHLDEKTYRKLSILCISLLSYNNIQLRKVSNTKIKNNRSTTTFTNPTKSPQTAWDIPRQSCSSFSYKAWQFSAPTSWERAPTAPQTKTSRCWFSASNRFLSVPCENLFLNLVQSF